MFQIKQSEATAARRRIPVLFVSSTDGFTPVTPTSPVAYISQNGATWVTTTNSVAVATLAAGQSAAGVYYLELTAAELASLGWITVNVQASNARQYNAHIQVMAYDPYDVVRIGLTSIPNVAQGSAGAIPTGSATGQVTVATNNDKTGYSLTQAFPTNFASMAITAGGAVTAGTVNDKTGYSLATAPPTAAQISTQVWSEALPGAFTSGQAGFKLDAGTATSVWAAGTRTLTAGTNIVLAKGTGVTGFNDITAQNVWDTATTSLTTAGSIGLKLNTNVDTTISSRMATFTYTTPPTAAAIATQVWSEALPGTYTSGQAGFKLNAAGSAADPWSTALPGAYAAGSAGNIIGNRLDAAISSRMATFTLPTNFSTLAISGTGAVTAGTVSDKTGYSLAVSPPTAATIATQVWSEALPGTYTSGQAGFKLNAAGTASDPWSTALPGAYSAGSAGNIIGNMVSNTWSAATRTLTSGANIVLAKTTNITGFNDITAQSVWDILSSAVSITGSMGLLLKTNVDATISSRLASSSYTTPPTAATISSTVWGDSVASYLNTGSFGYRLLRSDSTTHSGDVQVNGNGSANNHNRIDSDVHAIASDATAATNLKNLLPVAGKIAGTVTGIENITFPTNFNILAIQSSTGYVTATNGGGGGGTTARVYTGDYSLRQTGSDVTDITEVYLTDTPSFELNLVDQESQPVTVTGSTLNVRVLDVAGNQTLTATPSIQYGDGGIIRWTGTGTFNALGFQVGMYRLYVDRTADLVTTTFGPLQVKVQSQ